jgi:hypothetical protein
MDPVRLEIGCPEYAEVCDGVEYELETGAVVGTPLDWPKLYDDGVGDIGAATISFHGPAAGDIGYSPDLRLTSEPTHLLLPSTERCLTKAFSCAGGCAGGTGA